LATEIRFGKYLKEDQKLAAEVTGITLCSIDVYRLLQPYVTSRVMEQAKAVAPLAVYLMVFQLVILRQEVIQ